MYEKTMTKDSFRFMGQAFFKSDFPKLQKSLGKGTLAAP